LLRQVDAGVITLDDTVTELVTELELAAAPEQLSKTTVHDLLAHLSACLTTPRGSSCRETTGSAR
jgi:CubicO group peptidase (beta-lactamase class C family)